ncbi:MAG: NAD(P)(+) transhydrogenase (Re/Si-specific) subunit beta [Lysobacterales bacterium]
MNLGTLIQASYFLAAVMFIFGLKRMSSPVTARQGIVQAGIGMVIASLATFAFYFEPQAGGMVVHTENLVLCVIAIAIGTSVAWISGKRVAMTDMPQMVALYNGMGGGSAAAIGAVELFKAAAIAAAAVGAADMSHAAESFGFTKALLAVVGALIGAVSFSGSLIAFAKLQGWMDKVYRFPGQQAFNLLLFVAAIALGVMIIYQLDARLIIAFFIVCLVLGVSMTLPIGGADMPVVISLYNAFTGLAVAFEGYVMQNPALIIAGMVVGAAGTLLTQLMAKAMNRPISNVLFSNFGGAGAAAQEITGSQKPVEASDAAVMMAYAERVVIVPGYGMAVAQAQHKIWELTQQLMKRGVKVRFAIHPVAGRMPGHMNVLLAEAGVPYDLIADMDDINPEFPNTDVSIVIGANDVVNPVAKTDPASPIYGMPILDVSASKNVIVIKRGKGTGFAGIENALFYQDNTRMLFMDGQAAAAALVGAMKELDGGH